MGQVSAKLHRVEGGYSHWCPGCCEMHTIPAGWKFNGDVNSPTFAPSVKITGVQTVKDADGKWTGEWMQDAAGQPIPRICHYFLSAGRLRFCDDCTHSLVNQDVPLPDLPVGMKDG